ncbi:MAG: small multi-drug export protein [Lachnospiraceae bacterium]|nr:small multi-drug export protein [Robinsoniella sp.]MDY3767801.1 small multi-drug export protein [Lachnospiraceae bacterium]
METLVQWFTTNLSGVLSKELIAFVISMIPILELRGGLLAASWMHIDMARAIVICVIGNLIPIPFILLLITKIFNVLKQTKIFRPMVEKLERKALGKKDQIEKYEFWGLVLFVGIPLPGTGAWTGALIASLLGIRFRKAFPAIVLGILLATCIMTTLSYGILGKVW